jgi:hypothetical protein
MPEKLLRLGFTEMTLLLIYWLEKYNNNKKDIDSKKSLIKWLYTTSGYYDNKISSYYMDACHPNEKDPIVYEKYFESLLHFIKNSDNFSFGVHRKPDDKELNDFINFLQLKNQQPLDINFFYNKIQNRKILIISPFAKLMKQQYESRNCYKIYSNFPEIEKVSYYTNVYTFFNKGPHNNILETIDYLFNNVNNTINSNDYDMVIISAGAYSNLLAKKFYDVGKDVLTIGGDIQAMFGILNGRTRKWHLNNKKLENEEYWITKIPDKYKPNDYMKIENGCYW